MKKTLFLSAILGAALCSNAFAETTYNGVTYSGHILNIATSASATFHNRNFSDFYYNGEEWTNGKEFAGNTRTYYFGADETGSSTGNVDAWNYFFASGSGKYSTLRLTGATQNVYLESQFTPLTLGGMIAEAGDYTYTIGRKDGGCGIVIHAEEGQQANLTIASDVRLSAGTLSANNQNKIIVESAGTWNIANGKTLTLAHFDGSGNETPAAGGIYVNANVALTGQGTLKLNGTSVNLGNNASLSVSGDSKLALCGVMAIGSGASLSFADGATLVADNMVHGDVTFAGQESGLQTGSITYTLASGNGSVVRNGTQKFSIGGAAQAIETWAADNKSFTSSSQYYRIAQEGTVSVADVNSAISGSTDPVAGIWVDGTLTNVTNNAAPSKAVLGNGVVKITGDYSKGASSQLGEFNGTLHITGASARTLFYTGNSVGSNAEVELGVRGQIVSDNGKTFTNAITIGDFSESGIVDSLLPTIYANSRTESTINSTFNLNGHTLFKQGAGTLNVTSKAAVSSLLGSGVANNGKLVIDGGGTLRLGADSSYDFGDNYGTSIEVRNGTLDLRTEKRAGNTKTFNGDLTMKDGTLLSLYDGGAKFAGNVNLVSGTINMNSNWGKMGIELAGLVSGSANVYMTDGANNQTETYTISHADNTFSGTYFVGKNSGGTVAGSKVTLKAANATALKDATVNLVGGDKSALQLTTDTATVDTLSGVSGSTVTTSATATELQVGAGEFAGIISGAISLNKVGSGTLTLSAKNTYTGTTTITAGTLKLTDGDQTGLIKGEVTVKNGATLDLAGNDSLGWGINNVTALNIEQGGKLFVSAAGDRQGGGKYNQTFQKMAITLTGATISGNEGATIDLFNNNNVAGNYTTLTVNAAAGATAANPTVSTVDSNVTLKLRQNSTTITVAENAALVIANGLKKNGGTPILVKAGAGSLKLGAASDYDGGTTISEGTVVMGNASALGTGAVSIAAGATLDVNGNTIANAITTAGNIVNNGGELYSLSNGLQNVTLSGDAVIGGSKAISMVKNGGADTATLDMGDNNYTLTVSNDKGLYMNKTNVTGGGAIDVKKGSIVFYGSVDAAGTTLNLQNGAKLEINKDSAIGGLTGSGSIIIATDQTAGKQDSTLTINTVSGTPASSAATINGENHLTIKKTGAGEQIFTGALTNIKSIVVEEGDLTVKAASTVKQLGGSGTVKALADLTVTEAEEGKVKLGGMEIAGNTTVTVNDHAGTLTLKNLTVAGSGSTINANLAISGGTMTMSSSVEMGCSVTLSNENLVLTNGDVEDGVLQSYTLFTDVESLTLGTNENVAMGWYDVTADIIKSITVGTGATAITIDPANCVIGYWNGTVTISDKSVPEPATATLSLLALAALASRRKRK